MPGHVDAVTSSGHVEGWAFDPAAPLDPLVVRVVIDGLAAARGFANRYRADLAAAGYAAGWCAFRLRLADARRWPADADDADGVAVSLFREPDDAELFAGRVAADRPDEEGVLATLDQVAEADPTLVHAIDQLRGCDALLENFVASSGVDMFVHAAYLYVLGRRADATSLAACAAALRGQSMTPFDLLRTLHDSAEFRAAPRLLAAPTQPGFVFRGV